MPLYNSITERADALNCDLRNSFIDRETGKELIIKSQLPSAERFERWVFDEVLPTIRRTGGYVNNDELFIKTYLPYADEGTKLIFAQTLKTVREQNETIKQQKAEIACKLFENDVEKLKAEWESIVS